MEIVLNAAGDFTFLKTVLLTEAIVFVTASEDAVILHSEKSAKMRLAMKVALETQKISILNVPLPWIKFLSIVDFFFKSVF